ncbi:DUF5615 family PIN-like protein [Dyadobacter arcticus]|uniref:Nuclease of putative toxin-antitoxin system n=1 Tax=Dyadobacter arcticus TaxID=1078754 RepID=A0ABX0UIH5_9BACT|nr:DUF5615 family PIN-like protein [Dyadobacter arcticus]NIJ51869.1 putative nuclease of putative toxin-antitoxin system [Dyadobacter arcticus]
MKLLIDQNISHRIMLLLGSEFRDLRHVKDLGMINVDDYEIFMFTRKNDYSAITTIDDDFVKLLDIFSAPHKIIWVRTGNCSTHYLSEILISKANAIQAFLADENYFLYEVFKQI